MDSLHILHLSGSTHHWSGNEQQLADLMRNLKTLGTESSVFCYKGSAIEHYAGKNGIPCFAQERRSIYSPVLAHRLKRCIRENKFDAIHVHTSNFLTVFMIADILYGLHMPTVFSRKGFSEKSGRLSRLKYNYKGIDRIICVSGAVYDNFISFLKPRNRFKPVVIYDGISVDGLKREENLPDVRKTYGIPEGKYIVGNIANHVYAKDLPVLVRTADYLINKMGRKDVCVLQMGDMTEITRELNAMIEDAGLGAHVIFAGKVENARKFMPQFDVFLMTSRSEGLPLTIYEAFLNKIPVVTTDAGGIPEAVKNGFNGYITGVGNFKQLAEYVDSLLGDAERRRSMADNAHRTLLEKFTARQCAERSNELYKSILR